MKIPKKVMRRIEQDMAAMPKQERQRWRAKLIRSMTATEKTMRSWSNEELVNGMYLRYEILAPYMRPERKYATWTNPDLVNASFKAEGEGAALAIACRAHDAGYRTVLEFIRARYSAKIVSLRGEIEAMGPSA